MRALLLIYFIATIAHATWADETNSKKSKIALFISTVVCRIVRRLLISVYKWPKEK